MSIPNKYFCKKCCEKQEFTIETQTLSHMVDGIQFNSEDSICTCKKCGEKMYVPEVFERNVDLYFDAYYAAKALARNTQPIMED